MNKVQSTKYITIGGIYQRSHWPWSLWRLYAADANTRTVKLEHIYIKNVHWIGGFYEFRTTFKNQD